jgi:hypothetical protein
MLPGTSSRLWLSTIMRGDGRRKRANEAAPDLRLGLGDAALSRTGAPAGPLRLTVASS